MGLTTDRKGRASARLFDKRKKPVRCCKDATLSGRMKEMCCERDETGDIFNKKGIYHDFFFEHHKDFNDDKKEKRQPGRSIGMTLTQTQKRLICGLKQFPVSEESQKAIFFFLYRNEAYMQEMIEFLALNENATENEILEKLVQILHKPSENEMAIAAILKELGAEEKFITAVRGTLREDEAMKEKHCEKLLKYIDAKGKRITKQDVMSKCRQIVQPREQYYPPNMWVRCITGSVPSLKFDKIYPVWISYDGDKAFNVRDENKEDKEYPGEYFELLEVAAAVYVGRDNYDGTRTITDGFELNREYRVLGMKRLEYRLEDGTKCFFGEFEPVEFKKAEERQPVKFRKENSILQALRRAFEFGEIGAIRDSLNEFSSYVSQDSGVNLQGKDSIIKHLKTVANTQLKEDIYIDCAFATVTESAEGNRYPVGTRCMPIYQDGQCISVVFATTDDNVYYKEIAVLTEPYRFELDEQ